MESQPQNPEFRINPENFHPWKESSGRSVNSAEPLLLVYINYV